MSNIEKAEQQLENLDSLRFTLTTKEQAGKAMVFAKKLKKFAAELEEKVKARGAEIMIDENVEELVCGDYTIKQIGASESIEYSPKPFVELFGPEKALQLLKVDNTKAKRIIIAGVKKGKLTQEMIDKLKEGAKTKYRKGYIGIYETKKLNFFK